MRTSCIMVGLLWSIVFCGVFASFPSETEAKSAVWNTNYGGILAYYWDGNTNGSGEVGWAPGLKNFNLTIVFVSYAYHNGSLLPVDGTTVAVGDTVSFAAPQADADISWFGTGDSLDSPYGHWLAGAVRPVSFGGDYVGKAFVNLIDVYIPLSVNPPAITYTHTGSTAGLSCNSAGSSCTITSPGNILTQVNFSATYGKFYYAYIGLGATDYSPLAMRMCDALATGGHCSVPGVDYIVPIPAQQFTFSQTAVGGSGSGNAAPTIPVVNCPSTAPVSTLFNCSASASDPNGDPIRYAYDWNADGLPDEYVPAVSYVASGTTQSLTHTYITIGAKVVRVRAEDNRGGVSGWGSTTITIMSGAAPPPPPPPVIPTVDLKINGSDGPLNLTFGASRNFTWTVTDATSCIASSSDGWAGNKLLPSGSESLPANATTNHVLTCTGPGGTNSDSVQVNIVCVPITGAYGVCDCATETKSRINTNAACLPWTETTACTAAEKDSCRDLNWREVGQ